ncbi:MAG: carboxy terminal-processing peptidase [Planctomycetaceae bacterium]
MQGFFSVRSMDGSAPISPGVNAPAAQEVATSSFASIRETSRGKRLFRKVARGLLALSLAAIAFPSIAWSAELAQPRPADRQVSRAVTNLMKREHLTKHALDDEISQRALGLFLKTLDSRKLYFTAADIAEFDQNKNDLDDMVNNGDISFAYKVFNRLLKRIDERIVKVDEALKGEFSFEEDENLSTDWDKIPFAKTDAELDDRWRKMLKYEMLVLKTAKDDKKEKKKDEDPRQRLSRRYHSFAQRMHQTDADELLEMFLTAITSSYDPHTTYMSPKSLENFRILMSLNLDGIGAQLKFDDGYTVIDKIVPGGAAAKQGQLAVQDRVVQVGQGDDGKMEDVVAMKLDDVVNKIRGKAGTVVRLGVIPAGGGDIKIVKITRARIELKDSEARGVIFEEGKKQNGDPFKVGVIDLPSFYMDMEAARNGGDFKSTTVDVKKILVDFNAKGVDALILDLRKNGGGSLTEAINLTGLFIEDGPVVQVKDPDGRVQHYDDPDRSITWKGPLVVLTSKFSASASEILAGAIQDYHRGLIIGDSSSHGKGTVQSLLDLGPQMFRISNPPNLGALKLTMQQFYRPNGDSTQRRGVLADVVLPSITDHMDVSEGDLDHALAFDKVQSAQFNPFADTSPDIVSKLRDSSQKRMAQSPDFTKLQKKIERYTEQKQQKQIPLSEKKFLARRAELDAEKEEDEHLEDNANEKEVVKRDFYFNEALEVTLDYLRLMGKDKVAGK